MKFPLEVNPWSLHVAEAAESLSKATSAEGETRSSQANGTDRPVLVRGSHHCDVAHSRVTGRWSRRLTGGLSQCLLFNVVGNVAGHPGEEMSCKVKLSINWCVGPTLTCGRERLAVTWSTRLGIQAAEMRLAWPVALEIGQRVQSRAVALWCGWFWSCDQNASAFEPGYRPVG